MQVDTVGIIDVGLLAPDSCRAFFSACRWGGLHLARAPPAPGSSQAALLRPSSAPLPTQHASKSASHKQCHKQKQPGRLQPPPPPPPDTHTHTHPLIQTSLPLPPSRCSFGKDSEDSTVMTLSPAGLQQRAGLPLAGMSIHLKPRAAPPR